ncbi:unnamed protein product [Caretta caretta]
MPRAGLLLLSLLLCFGTETARSIDSATFKAIMDHVHQCIAPSPSPTTVQYAVAISLLQSVCKGTSPSELQKHLPMARLQAMKSKLEMDLLYEGNHIVATKPDKRGQHSLHSEWLMLRLDQNGVSPVSLLLDKARDQTKCQVPHALEGPEGRPSHPGTHGQDLRCHRQ